MPTAKKVAPPKMVDVTPGQLSIERVGGWTQAGLVAMTYHEALPGGRVEIISKRHLYHPIAGRDLYPLPEQLEAMKAGQPVKFTGKQWA